MNPDVQGNSEGANAHSRIDSALFSDVASKVVASITQDQRTHLTSASRAPHAEEIAELNRRLRWLAFPGFFGPRDLHADDLERHVRQLLEDLGDRLWRQVEIACEYVAAGEDDDATERTMPRDAGEVVSGFMSRLADIRRMLAQDVQAAFDGDPAARHLDEVILCQPGLRAVMVHRFAHELHRLGVPLLPRMMAEGAHSVTGVDIHPGASIGEAFFIDHGTGVVIGETTEVGARCKIYQGVTLGAASFDRDSDGSLRRGYKRHPTLEDDVTVYAGATILGGGTVIGSGSIVNGGVFLTRSVPPNSTVQGPKLEIRLRTQEDM